MQDRNEKGVAFATCDAFFQVTSIISARFSQMNSGRHAVLH